MSIPMWLPVVICAFLFALLADQKGITATAVIHSIWLATLVQVAMFDLRWRLILDIVTYPTAVLAIALSPLVAGLGPINSLEGLLAGLLMLAPFALGGMFSSQEIAFGWGDVKLGGMMGAMLGISTTAWRFPALYAIVLGAVLGGVVITILLATKRLNWHQAVAYGPFLAAGGVATIFLF
jgi:leader peptidase (prepilin peptidase)/N-methyltransferase